MQETIIVSFLSKFWGLIAGAIAVVFGYGRLNSRLEGVEKKTEHIDSKVSQALERMTDKFEQDRADRLNREDRLRTEMTTGFQRVEDRLASLHNNSLRSLSNDR